ncbi:MAG: hypothetical protein J5950_10890, partial [Clostridia bacterium]|nr:hypothetical protein [Clostridia bacterium]
AIDDRKNVKFYGYNKSLIKIKNNMIYSKGKTGTTTVKVSYKGYYTEFKVFVHDDFSQFRDNFGKTVAEFTPIKEVYEVKMWDRHHQQLRGLVRFSDGTWGEAFNDGEMIDYKKFPVTYEVADTSVAVVNDRGLIFPLTAGDTDVKVTIAGEKSFTVKIIVKQE